MRHRLRGAWRVPLPRPPPQLHASRVSRIEGGKRQLRGACQRVRRRGGGEENKRQESLVSVGVAKNRRGGLYTAAAEGGGGDPNEDPPLYREPTGHTRVGVKEGGTGKEVLAETFGGVAGDAVPELTDGTLEQALAEAKVLKSEREALLRSVNQKEAEVAALRNLHELASKGGDGTGGAPAADVAASDPVPSSPQLVSEVHNYVDCNG